LSQAKFVVASDSVNINTQLSFIDSSANLPTTWLWDFGDGSTSTLPNPIHQYQQTGIYIVSLTVGNCAGSSAFIDTVVILATTVKYPNPSIGIKLSPNPSSGLFNLQVTNTENGTYQCVIYAMDGKQMYMNTFAKNTTTLNTPINLHGVAAGVYVLTVSAPSGQVYHCKVVVERY
jgi:PKD repeat protein